MVIIEWKDTAWQLYNDLLEYAKIEFGAKTGRRWEKELLAIYERLRLYPTSYPLEELLTGREVTFRRCHMMHRRFKLIYFYDDITNVVHIVDIWDSRMSPTKLEQRV